MICDAFERAAEKVGETRRYYLIGQNTVCLRFAGPALLPLLDGALAHRETPACDPGLMVLCFDGDFLPVSVLSNLWILARDHSPGECGDGIRILDTPAVPGLTLFSPSHNLAVYWVYDARLVHYEVRAAPFRHLFHWWFRDTRLALVQAAAVGTDRGGVLLAGRAGAGTSSTALACLNSPLQYAGDDYVAVTSEPEPFVYSLYNSAKLDRDYLDMFPAVEEKSLDSEALCYGKALLFLHERYAQQLNAGFPVKAILLPRITHEPLTRLSPATGKEALLALSLTTLTLMEHDSRLALDKMSRLVRSVPKYWLELGTNLEAIPPVIISLLENAA